MALDKVRLADDVLKELSSVIMDYRKNVTDYVVLNPFSPEKLSLNSQIGISPSKIRTMTYQSQKVTGLEAIVKAFSKRLVEHFQENMYLDDLADVDVTNAVDGQVLVKRGSSWIAENIQQNIYNTTTTTPEDDITNHETPMLTHNHGIGRNGFLTRFLDGSRGLLTEAGIREDVNSLYTIKPLYIEGTLSITSVPHLSSTSQKILVMNGYEVSYRTVAEVLGDVAAGSHNHDDLYYRKTEFNAGTAMVHWNCLTNLPLTFNPASHAVSHAPGSSDTIFPTNAIGYLRNNGSGILSWQEVTVDDFDFAPLVHVHAASDITSGTLSVSRGGTGSGNFSSGYLKGNGTSTFLVAVKIPWSDITGAPTTYTPENHDLVSSYHTVSGLTTGHFLKALSATTFGFAAHGLTYSDVGAQPIDATLTALAGLNTSVGFIYQTGTDTFTKYGFGGTGSATTLSRSDHTHTGYELAISTGLSTQYWRGDKTWQVLNTGAVLESTNLYFTNSRVYSAITGAISNLTTSNLTASRALISDTNGKIVVSTVTSTELGYVSGVTSAIQTQLNSKQSSITGLTTGYLPYWNNTAFSNSNVTYNAAGIEINSVDTSYNGGIRIVSDSTHYGVIALGCAAGGSGSQIGQWNILRYPSSSGYNLGFRYNNVTDFITLTSTGFLAIGTHTPSTMLHVASGNNAAITLGPNVSYSKNLLLGGWTTTDFSNSRIQVSNGNLHLDSELSHSIFLNNYVTGNTYLCNGGGNVGIGIEPTYKLHVSGSVGITQNINLGIVSNPTGTTTPYNINLGQTFSNNKLASSCKVILYNSGSAYYGFGIGNESDVQYHSWESTGTHRFYIQNTEKLRVSSDGSVTTHWNRNVIVYSPVDTGYASGNLELISDAITYPTRYPSIGFHRYGIDAATLLFKGGLTFNVRTNLSTNEYTLLHSGNLTGVQEDHWHTKLWSSSHPLTYYITNEWTGSYWRIKSNHSDACSVQHATLATNSDQWGGYHISGRTNWATNNALDIVVGQLAWKNYGNNHTIFDASASISPSGTSIDRSNSQRPWTAALCPTLMGWNGSETWGVRVDSARIADIANSVNGYSFGSQYPTAIPYYNGTTFESSGLLTGNGSFTMYLTNGTALSFYGLNGNNHIRNSGGGMLMLDDAYGDVNYNGSYCTNAYNSTYTITCSQFNVLYQMEIPFSYGSGYARNMGWTNNVWGVVDDGAAGRYFLSITAQYTAASGSWIVIVPRVYRSGVGYIDQFEFGDFSAIDSNISGTGIVELLEGDALSLWCKTEADHETFTFKRINVTMFYLGKSYAQIS